MFDFRSGSLPDISLGPTDVRLTPKNRTWFSAIVMSALCHKQTSVNLAATAMAASISPKKFGFNGMNGAAAIPKLTFRCKLGN